MELNLEVLIEAAAGRAAELAVAAVLRDHERTAGRLAFTEAEAAEMLGWEKHQLRDARLRKEITGAKLGRAIHYERSELLAFLAKSRIVTD